LQEKLNRVGCRKIRLVSREYYTKKLDVEAVFSEDGIQGTFVVYLILIFRALYFENRYACGH